MNDEDLKRLNTLRSDLDIQLLGETPCILLGQSYCELIRDALVEFAAQAEQLAECERLRAELSIVKAELDRTPARGGNLRSKIFDLEAQRFALERERDELRQQITVKDEALRRAKDSLTNLAASAGLNPNGFTSWIDTALNPTPKQSQDPTTEAAGT